MATEQNVWGWGVRWSCSKGQQKQAVILWTMELAFRVCLDIDEVAWKLPGYTIQIKGDTKKSIQLLTFD
jgi:hypothetical protein